MGVHDWWAGPVCASPDLVDTPIGENNCKWLRTNPHESPKAHASCIEHLTKALPKPIIDGVSVPPQVQDDDPIRALLPVTMTLIVLLVVGVIYPVVVALALFLAMFAATLFAAYLLVRMVQKFVRENSEPGGILHSWRPSLRSGLGTALGVLIRWAPFGFLSLLVFGANGLIVKWMAQFLEIGIESARGTVGDMATETAGLGEGWHSWFLPQSFEDLLKSTTSGLNSIRDLLANLLVLIGYLLVVEGFVSWIFLIWLTTRSVLYFLARTVLAEHSAREGAEASPIEVRFNMEFMR